MSAKTKGRGRKAAGKTQENVIGILNGDAEATEVVEAAKPKKEATKRKQAAPSKKVAAAAEPEKTEEVPSKRGRGRAAKEPDPEPEVEAPAPAVTKGKRGAAKKSDPKPEPKEEKAPAKAETHPVENGAKPKGKGRGKQAAAAPVEEPASTAQEETSTSKKGTKRGAGGKKNEAGTSQTNDIKSEVKEEEAAPTVAKRGRGSKATQTQSANSKVETQTEASETAEKGKRGRGAKGKAPEKAPTPPPAEAVENGVETEKPGRKGAAKKAPAAPAAGKKRGATKKAEPEPQPEENLQENGDNLEEEDHEEIITAAKKPRASNKKAPAKSGGDGKLMNATDTDYSKLDFSSDKEFNYKISSWNIAGMRAWIKKGGLEYIQHEKPDILCFQETKCIPDDIPEEARLPGYHPYWLCKPGGHAGVAIYSKIMPINVEYGLGDKEQDEDGRILTAEYEKFFLVCAYVPNAGRKLVTLPKRLRWNKLFEEFIQKLNEKKPVIICGDMNVAHNEIDLANPKTNKKNAGFTPEEREGMTDFLKLGYVDTYRHFYPDKERAYTFWAYFMNSRAKDVGWRLDYFLVSERILPKCVDNVIRSKVMGSDHCPITLLLKL